MDHGNHQNKFVMFSNFKAPQVAISRELARFRHLFVKCVAQAGRSLCWCKAFSLHSLLVFVPLILDGLMITRHYHDDSLWYTKFLFLTS